MSEPGCVIYGQADVEADSSNWNWKNTELQQGSNEEQEHHVPFLQLWKQVPPFTLLPLNVPICPAHQKKKILKTASDRAFYIQI